MKSKFLLILSLLTFWTLNAVADDVIPGNEPTISVPTNLIKANFRKLLKTNTPFIGEATISLDGKTYKLFIGYYMSGKALTDKHPVSYEWPESTDYRPTAEELFDNIYGDAVVMRFNGIFYDEGITTNVAGPNRFSYSTPRQPRLPKVGSIVTALYFNLVPWYDEAAPKDSRVKARVGYTKVR